MYFAKIHPLLVRFACFQMTILFNMSFIIFAPAQFYYNLHQCILWSENRVRPLKNNALSTKSPWHLSPPPWTAVHLANSASCTESPLPPRCPPGASGETADLAHRRSSSDLVASQRIRASWFFYWKFEQTDDYYPFNI